jgi:hypothetical protein
MKTPRQSEAAATRDTSRANRHALKSLMAPDLTPRLSRFKRGLERARFSLERLCLWRLTVDRLAALVGVLIQLQRLPVGTRQGHLAQLLAFDQRQRLFL